MNEQNLVAQHLDVRILPDGKSRLFIPGTDDGYYGPSLSPSAMSTAEECLHKWALSRLDNVQRPVNYQAERGTAVHAQLDEWLKKGTQPITKGMAKLLEHFPAPGTCESEGEFGFIFGRPDQEFVVKGRFDARRTGWLYDLKTTGDMRWKKTPAQLAVDLQASVYALSEMLRNNLDSVTCRWVYAVVPSPVRYFDNGEIDDEGSLRECRSPEFEIKRVDFTEVVLTRAQVMATLAHYVPLAEKMVAAIDGKKRAADCEKNASACESYGGCPFKKSGACEVPAGGGFLALVKQEKEKAARAETTTTKEKKNMGLLNKFKGAAGAPAAPAPTPASMTTPEPAKVEVVVKAAPAPEAASPSKQALVSRLSQLVNNPAKAAAVAAAADAAPAHHVTAVGINPPDAAPVWTQEEQARKSEEIVAGVKAPKGTDALPAESVTAQTVAAEDAQIEADKAAVKAAKEAEKAAVKAAKKTVKGVADVATAFAPAADGEMLAVLQRIAAALERIASK